jgi:hypothetical protein
VVGLATWTMLRRHSNEQVARAVVDLKGRSMARGMEPPTEPPLEIPHNASHLDIYLPLGSDDGLYDVRIASVQGEPLVSGTGEAKLERGLTVLRIDLVVSSAKPGTYLLQIRRHASEWASFSVRIR